MKNIFTSLLFSLVFLPAVASANVDLGEHAVQPLPGYASMNDFYAMQASKNTGDVGRLCPATKGEYAAKIDEFQTKIDSALANPGQCYAHINWIRGRRCVVHSAKFASMLEEQKQPTELCYELHTLKEAYDLVLADALIKTEEQKKSVTETLGTLETCLRDSKRRSEIESCYTAFRFSISQILGI